MSPEPHQLQGQTVFQRSKISPVQYSDTNPYLDSLGGVAEDLIAAAMAGPLAHPTLQQEEAEVGLHTANAVQAGPLFLLLVLVHSRRHIRLDVMRDDLNGEQVRFSLQSVSFLLFSSVCKNGL